MRISDWSSDVCSSDLHRYEDTPQVYISSANLILLAIQNESLSDNVDLPATADIDVIAKWQYAAQIMASIAAQSAGEIEPIISQRSEERREGKECVSPGRSRWAPYH